MQDVAGHLDDRRRQEFRRTVGVSLVLHAAIAVALLVSPGGSSVAPPEGVRVRLVSPPSASSPKPKAAPAPAPVARPKPKPKPPKPAPVVLPTEPSTPKPQAKPKPEAKPKPKPRPEPVPQTPPVEQDLSDVLDSLRSELGEEAPTDEPVETAQAVLTPGVPGGVRLSPEVKAWLRAAEVHVRRNWVVPPNFEMLSLVTTIDVELDRAGNVQGTPRVRERSDNPWYDENVVRSIQKASPLPAPPEAGKWTFQFYSDRD